MQDIDHTNDVIARLRRATGNRAVAGIFSPARAEEAAKLGFQELTSTAPGANQRQTVVPAFDEHEDEILRAQADDLSDVMEGKLSPDQPAMRMAESMANNIRKRIESNTPPELRPSTKENRRKRGNTSTDTLVDSGDMLKAIEHEVRDGEGVGDDG